MVRSMKKNTVEGCSKCNHDRRWRRRKMSPRKRSSRKVWLHQLTYMLEFLEDDYSSSVRTQRMKKKKKKSKLNVKHSIKEDTGIYNGHDCNFIRKVLREELGDHHQIEDNHKLMAIAVHAVLLDSGFVGFDTDLRDGVHRIHENFPVHWTTVSFCYTLPQILANNNNNNKVNLEFQKDGQCLIVSGSLPGPGSEIYQAFLYDHKHKQLISQRHVVLREFWIIIKNGIALPLLMDLCAKAGLPSPSCLMALNSDLQMKILDLLPGDDVARLECTCKELLLLTSHNSEFWRNKIPACTCELNAPPLINWKMLFCSYYRSVKWIDEDNEEEDQKEKREKMRAMVEKKGYILLPKSSIKGLCTSNIPFHRFSQEKRNIIRIKRFAQLVRKSKF